MQGTVPRSALGTQSNFFLTEHLRPGEGGGKHRQLEVNYDLNGKGNDRTAYTYRALCTQRRRTPDRLARRGSFKESFLEEVC